MTITPMFKWAGSKRRVLPKYQPFFYPPQGFDTFIDSFCGSVVVAKHIKEKFPDVKIVINDLNKELIALYSILGSNYTELMYNYALLVRKFCSLEPNHEYRKNFYYLVRQRYCTTQLEENPVKLAAMLLFMLKINFNGIWKAYKIMNGYYSTPPGANLDRYKEDFFYKTPWHKYSEFFSLCEMSSVSYDQIDIAKHKNPYVYLDPPYRDCSINYDNKGDLITGDAAQTKIIDHHLDQNCLFAFSNKERDDEFFTKLAKERGLKHQYVDVLHTAVRSTLNSEKPSVREILITNF